MKKRYRLPKELGGGVHEGEIWEYGEKVKFIIPDVGILNVLRSKVEEVKAPCPPLPAAASELQYLITGGSHDGFIVTWHLGSGYTLRDPGVGHKRHYGNWPTIWEKVGGWDVTVTPRHAQQAPSSHGDVTLPWKHGNGSSHTLAHVHVPANCDELVAINTLGYIYVKPVVARNMARALDAAADVAEANACKSS